MERYKNPLRQKFKTLFSDNCFICGGNNHDRNGETIKKLYSYADENTGSILRNVIEDTLDEYDDLSVNDRVSILLEMIEKIIK